MCKLPLVYLAIVRERSVASETRVIGTPTDAAETARPLVSDADREYVVALLLEAWDRAALTRLCRRQHRGRCDAPSIPRVARRGRTTRKAKCRLRIR